MKAIIYSTKVFEGNELTHFLPKKLPDEIVVR